VFRLVMTLLRRCALVSSVVALAIAIQVPALAGTYHHTDARHDVKRYPRSHAPHNRQSDVTHLQIVHNDKAVRFYLRFRSASMRGVRFRGFVIFLKTPSHSYRAGLDWRRSGARGDLVDTTTGQPVMCDQAISRHGHTYLIRIDRGCLGNPRWIRAAFITGVNLGTTRSFSDDPLSSNWRRPDGGGPFTPRVHSSS